MLYKEWVSVRYRMLLWLLVYAVLALALFMTWQPLIQTRVLGREYSYNINPLYGNWLNISLFLTLIAALFGGVENISDEMERGTLSFLLTKPVSRQRIYTTKILMNITALVTTFIPCSLVMFLIDRIQPFSIRLSEGLGLTVLWLTIGITLICLAGLVSVFTHNALQTIAFTIAIPTVIVAVVVFSVFYLAKVVTIGIQLDTQTTMLFWISCFAMLSVGLFWAGLRAFSRKQF